MRMILALTALLYSAAALAQSAAPPAAETAQPAGKGKPAKQARASKPAAKGSVAVRLQACQDIDDGTKDRLNCYDAVIAPKPNPKAKGPAKSVTECNAFKDEEERLTCFNGFVEKLPKLPS